MGLDYQSSVFKCKHRRGEGDNIENTSTCQLLVTLADSKLRNKKETKTKKNILHEITLPGKKLFICVHKLPKLKSLEQRNIPVLVHC